MKVIGPSWDIYWTMPGTEMLRVIERAGRTAYKSEDKIIDGSAEKFVRMIIERGHYSVLEHVSVSARVVTDRGISHEIVRHRIGVAYTQESTRFCSYNKAKFGNEITVIAPSTLEPGSEAYGVWESAMKTAEWSYFEMLRHGSKPQEARSVLPNSLKTEIVMTLNLRAWRHFFFLRASPNAHPDMQKISYGMLEEFRKHVPVVFDDVRE